MFLSSSKALDILVNSYLLTFNSVSPLVSLVWAFHRLLFRILSLTYYSIVVLVIIKLVFYLQMHWYSHSIIRNELKVLQACKIHHKVFHNAFNINSCICISKFYYWCFFLAIAGWNRGICEEKHVESRVPDTSLQARLSNLYMVDDYNFPSGTCICFDQFHQYTALGRIIHADLIHLKFKTFRQTFFA